MSLFIVRLCPGIRDRGRDRSGVRESHIKEIGEWEGEESGPNGRPWASGLHTVNLVTCLVSGGGGVGLLVCHVGGDVGGPGGGEATGWLYLAGWYKY